MYMNGSGAAGQAFYVHVYNFIVLFDSALHVLAGIHYRVML